MGRDFGYLKAQSASKVVRYVVRQLRTQHGSPVLLVEHLGETNQGWWLDVLARATAADDNTPKSGGKLTAQALAKAVTESRARNRGIVAKHAVRDLDNVFWGDGSAAVKDDIPALIDALPDDVFDALWAYVNDADHFRDYTIADSPANIAEK